MKFEVYRDQTAQDQWRWRLVASNGNIVADSAEGYKRRGACVKEISKIKVGVPLAPIIERLALGSTRETITPKE